MSPIRERIVSGVSMFDIERALQYYHGIAIENKMTDKIDDIIVDQIEKKMPVLTYVQPTVCLYQTVLISLSPQKKIEISTKNLC